MSTSKITITWTTHFMSTSTSTRTRVHESMSTEYFRPMSVLQHAKIVRLDLLAMTSLVATHAPEESSNLTV